MRMVYHPTVIHERAYTVAPTLSRLDMAHPNKNLHSSHLRTPPYEHSDDDSQKEDTENDESPLG